MSDPSWKTTLLTSTITMSIVLTLGYLYVWMVGL